MDYDCLLNEKSCSPSISTKVINEPGKYANVEIERDTYYKQGSTQKRDHMTITGI